MRRMFALVLLSALVIAFGLRVWTNENLSPLRGQLQDVITLALSLLFESLPFIILGIGLSVIFQVFVPSRWLQGWLPGNPFARRAIVSLFGIVLPVCECGSFII